MCSITKLISTPSFYLCDIIKNDPLPCIVDIEAKMAGDCIKAYGLKSINFSSGTNIGTFPEPIFPDSMIRV